MFFFSGRRRAKWAAEGHCDKTHSSFKTLSLFCIHWYVRANSHEFHLARSEHNELKALLSSDKANFIEILSNLGFQCASEPAAPANGRLKCVSNVCQASCLPDYKFPTGDSSLTLGCVNGRWMVKSLNLNEVPACERNYWELFREQE